MSILDKIKGKKESKPVAHDHKHEHEENVLDMVKEPASAKASAGETPALKENTGTAHRILHRYHLSEKTNQFSSIGRYVFKVDSHTNKIEVKKAVEKVYDVHVVKVNMVNVLGKKRRQGKTVGRTQDWKKAIVTLRDGERIAGLAEGV
jgi:large subunit ribosomal protein L23